MKNKQLGFTLLEVLVALAILAIALAAVSRASGLQIYHTDEMRNRLLADWVAQNRLVAHNARGDWLDVGIQEGEEQQAGITFYWKEEIIGTPNPAFRRIDVSVYSSKERQYALRKLSGYLVEQRRK